MIKIKQGLNLPITGQPKQVIENASTKHVALVGADYVGMKPTMEVKVGDQVKTGQLLFVDKKNPGVRYVAPAAGQVTEVNRGEKRVLQSVVIAVSGQDEVSFTSHSESDLLGLDRQRVEDQLNEAGLWVAFRTRPFSKAPALGSKPHSIFVTAMDTNPLAPDMKLILSGQEHLFNTGLKVISKLTDGKIFICKGEGLQISTPDMPNLHFETFKGPHPAGLPGTHIHKLDPVGNQKTVWNISLQEVIAIGHLFSKGRLQTTRIISFAGPGAREPKHLRVNLGASISELARGRIHEAEQRIVSGSVLAGRKATSGPYSYVGRYHQIVSVLAEGRERELLGWHMPGFDKFSVRKTFASSIFKNKKFDFTTSTGGSERAMVPTDIYDKVTPLDVEAAYLLRSLLTHDTEFAQQLGALELDEEDLGLLTFVCPTKLDYGPYLRRLLTTIEVEG